MKLEPKGQVRVVSDRSRKQLHSSHGVKMLPINALNDLEYHVVWRIPLLTQRFLMFSAGGGNSRRRCDSALAC